MTPPSRLLRRAVSSSWKDTAAKISNPPTRASASQLRMKVRSGVALPDPPLSGTLPERDLKLPSRRDRPKAATTPPSRTKPTISQRVRLAAPDSRCVTGDTCAAVMPTLCASAGIAASLDIRSVPLARHADVKRPDWQAALPSKATLANADRSYDQTEHFEHGSLDRGSERGD